MADIAMIWRPNKQPAVFPTVDEAVFTANNHTCLGKALLAVSHLVFGINRVGVYCSGCESYFISHSVNTEEAITKSLVWDRVVPESTLQTAKASMTCAAYEG